MFAQYNWNTRISCWLYGTSENQILLCYNAFFVNTMSLTSTLSRGGQSWMAWWFRNEACGGQTIDHIRKVVFSFRYTMAILLLTWTSKVITIFRIPSHEYSHLLSGLLWQPVPFLVLSVQKAQTFLPVGRVYLVLLQQILLLNRTTIAKRQWCIVHLIDQWPPNAVQRCESPLIRSKGEN
jgi:hypothetical protein